MRLVAQEILSAGSNEHELWRAQESSEEVRALRALLRTSPNNIIALVDLAQHHLATGKREAAWRALATAHQLSPNSVYVTRTFARYWIHLEQPDRAHSLLKSAKLTPHDPWLMASEIAVSEAAAKQSTQLRRAQKALANKQFSPSDVSELAGAIAGVELRHGNYKEARRLFRLALLHPNDNVLAQAITSQQHLGIEVDDHLLSQAPQGAAEGRSLNSLITADFHAGAEFTEQWSREEAFSSRPRTLQSYFFGALGEYNLSLASADAGLTADPSDEALQGNRIYALAALGRLGDAELELRQLEPKASEEQKPLLLATRGMIALLGGDSGAGLGMYEVAIQEFTKSSRDELVTDCLAFMARHARTARLPETAQILLRAKERFNSKPSPAAAVILEQLGQEVARPEPPKLHKTVQWEWDPKRNVLVANRELTRRGAPGVVVTPVSRKGS